MYILHKKAQEEMLVNFWIKEQNIWNMLITVIIISLIFLAFICVDFKSRRSEVKVVHSYISRVVLSVLYFILGVIVIIFFRDQIFYLEERNNLLFDSTQLNDWPRFAWCGGFTLMGFGFAALQSRFSPKLPYFPYLFYYPYSLLLITCLSYSLLSLNSSTRGYVFYPLSLAFSGTLGVLVDRYWDLATNLLKK